MSLRFWKGTRLEYNEDNPEFTLKQSFRVLRKLAEECLGRQVGANEEVAKVCQEIAEKRGWFVL